MTALSGFFLMGLHFWKSSRILMTMKRFLFKLVLLMFLVTGCVSFAEAGAKYQYLKRYRQATQSQEVYQRRDLYSSLNWSATLLGPKLRDAQKKYIESIYAHSDLGKDDAVIDFDVTKEIVFIVNFYAYDEKTSNLADKNHQWALSLHTPETQVAPARIIPLKNKSSLQKVLYPYQEAWQNAYFVVFEKSSVLGTQDKDNIKYLELFVEGPMGHGRLRMKAKDL